MIQKYDKGGKLCYIRVREWGVHVDSTINMIYWVTPSYRWLSRACEGLSRACEGLGGKLAKRAFGLSDKP